MTARLPATWIPPIAAKQSGLFTVGQAIAAGMSYAQVRRRRDSDRWVTVVGDALSLAAVSSSPWLRAQGAGLTWPDAVVCLGSAAAVHGIPIEPSQDVHVIVPHRRAGRRHLITHQLRLGPREVFWAGIAKVTNRSRTIFDCVGRLPDAESEAVMSWALTRELITREELAAAVAERGRWWGNTRRRQALDDTVAGALGAGERRLHDLLTRAGLTGWLADQKIWDSKGLIGRADVLFRSAKLVVEMDGAAYHGAERFQSDRTRQNRLVNAGYTVLRFTWADLHDRPDEVIRQIRAALARASSLSGRM